MSFSALILAGSRPGAIDPVAASEGIAHKALAMVAGETALARVAAALRKAGATRIGLSASDAGVIELGNALGLETIATAPGPSESAGLGFAALGSPLVVTTADHALLRPEWVTALIHGTPGGADVSVMLAERALVEAAAETKRTWLRFADGDWSGCNLFLLRTPDAARAIELWRMVEADRKRPWRIVRRFGPGMLVRYLLGRLTLAEAVARLGALAGVRAGVVAARDGLAAVDVDKPADLDAVRALLNR